MNTAISRILNIEFFIGFFERKYVYSFMMKSKRAIQGVSKTGGDFSPLDKRYDAEDLSSIVPSVLDSFPYEYKGKELVVRIETDEFTAVCPWSGLPDFGTVFVEYIPRDVCIELRSFKYYLLS